MSIVNVPHVPLKGLKHLHYGRIDQITDGPWMAGFASFVNMLTGRRQKLLYSKFEACIEDRFLDSSVSRCNHMFRTSPYTGGVQCVALLRRLYSTSAQGEYTWTVNGVAQPTMYAGAENVMTFDGPDMIFMQSQTFVDGSGDPLAGNTVYEASLSVTSGLVLGVCVFETWKSQLVTGTGGVPLDVYAVGSPVLDRDIASLTDQLWTLYCQQGTHHIRWSHGGAGAADPTRTGTTWENVLDGTTTGYGANAAGHWVYPYRRNTLAGSTVAVTFWTYASSSSGTTGQVRFVNNDGTIATITGIGALDWYSTTGVFDTTLTEDLVIVEMNNTNVAATTTVRDYGCYEYTT